MADALAIKVRYETPGPNGETRAERNERFGKSELNPDYDIPDEGMYIWDWYEELSSGFQTIANGNPVPIPPSEILAWSQLSGNVVSPEEYDMLRQMDAARREAQAVELEYHRSVAQAEADAKAAQANKGGKRRGR